MRKITIIMGLLCALNACTVATSKEVEQKLSKESTMKGEEKKDEEIIKVALFYVKEGQEKTFEKLRSRGNVLLEKYGAKIERVVKPQMLAEGELELPTEIHFASYPSMEALQAFNEDPEFLKLKEEVVAPSVEKMYGFVTKNTDFEFIREIGDSKKTYGIALVYFNEGEKYVKQFEEYHDEVCAIMPEFGTHFERFLAPFDTKGDLAQPDEIHRFYFESQEGMQGMMTDQRMQQLFPKRDESLSNLIFFIGEAVQ